MSAKDKKDAKATLKDMADKVAEPARKAGKAIRETGERAVANSAQISAKMIDQAEANTREAFAAMRAATKAKDLSEVMKIQGDFLRDQGKRSLDHAREIGELIATLGKDAVGTLRGK